MDTFKEKLIEALDADNTPDGVRGWIRINFPELRESEDERIRKELVDFINHYRHNTDLTSEQAEWCKETIAYLEKQKELPFVKDVVLGFPGLYFYDGERMHFQGNPATEENPYDFAMSQQEKQKEQKPVKLDDDTEVGLDRALQIVKHAKGNLCGYQSDDGIYECDHAIQTLERILKNGIEQKPAEWSEEDENNLKSVISKIKLDIQRWGDHGKTMVDFDNGLIEWVKKLPNRFAIHNKQEWSEEDERICNGLKGLIPQCMTAQSYNLYYNWLKNLPNRISLQPNAEWSEEDEEALDMCVDAIPKAWKTKSGILLTKWLKDNIRPHGITGSNPSVPIGNPARSRWRH